ncbi:ATP-dependent helicase DinG [Ammoniphilus oxalaticus]|uniref:3'-5' exonuclease DinG n=1 Tax=Ammoniphilus oxalaticus TaxID=66863 RepID=A0A419SN63_9BACL|nr:ATP-dependent DNA helicase DinG [Ammoniphilus oxalaticus]RKD25750.1 ATP-dependent helicase DinG [Ammoniphilus oxalaticus]
MNKFLVVDFETTGNKPKDGDQIIQIGAVLIEQGEIVSQLSTLVNPGIPIPPFIQQLTKINDAMVQDAPPIDEAIAKMLPLLDGAAFVAHNVHFDLGFLQAALSDAGYLPFTGPILDTVELSRLLLPGQTGYKLSELSSDLDVEHEAPHQADSDAQATADIFLTLIEKLNALPLLVIQRLIDLTKNFSSNISLLIESIEQQRLLRPQLGDDDEQLEMFRQIALQRKDEAGHAVIDVEAIPAFPTFVSELYEQMAEHMTDFELRPAQREMMQQIYDAFSDGRHLLVEAGTGTGKSLAYLTPALYWAAQESDEKVVISTHTIQLQEQLYAKDLPLLAKLLDFPFTAAIFKGRNNYLCLRKFEMSLSDSFDNYDVQLSKGQILTWLTETQTGDVEEINLPSGGQLYWRQVQSDANSCLHNQCPWFSRCFYYSARRKAAEADVVITNHSLLFTDLQAEQRILPPYRYAIIDEAHQFEEVASNHLGLSFNSLQMDALLNELTVDRGSGLLDRITQECVSLPIWKEIGSEVETSLQMTVELKEYAKDLFNQLYNWGRRAGKESPEQGRLVKRYQPGEWRGRKQVTQSITYAQDWIRLLKTSLEKVYVGLFDDVEAAKQQLKSLAVDLAGQIKELEKWNEALQRLLIEPEEGHVYWMELDTRSTRRGVFLRMTPIEIAPQLREQFFKQKESVALTSATLSVNQSFDYTMKRLGLETEAVESIHHGSPFDFEKQTMLCVPNDIPALTRNEESAFIKELTRSLGDLAQVTAGRMMVLFTSYQMLRQVYEPLKQQLSGAGFTVLGHGIDSNSRTKLTKQFIETPNCILLGASSFWEGVDIPGEALSCLAIVRLPFWPPNHPVVEARNEQIKARNGNPFMELSVPQAVIRFKQGFGRLVRTQRDKGIVIVYDKRIVESRYGRFFIRSLPQTPLVNRPMNELLPMIEQWFDEQ